MSKKFFKISDKTKNKKLQNSMKTAHEFARELLNGPDIPILIPSYILT